MTTRNGGGGRVIRTVQGVVCGVAVAADEQHRQPLGAVGVVMVLIASEDHEQREGSSAGKPVGSLPRLRRVDVRCPSAWAQDKFCHWLFMFDAVPSKPLSLKAVQAFFQGVLRDAIVDVNERVRRVGSSGPNAASTASRSRSAVLRLTRKSDWIRSRVSPPCAA